MARFLSLSLTFLVLSMAAFAFVLDWLGYLPPDTSEARFGFGGHGLPGHIVLATWILEALALTGLFLLVQRRAGPQWIDGLLAGWVAWVFRGPLLVITVVGAAGLAPGPWWQMALCWLGLYTFCGLLLAALSSLLGLER